jgi:hypothetical protein
MFAAAPAEIASAGHAQTPAQTPKPAQIDRNGVLILIRSSLLALDQANKTGAARHRRARRTSRNRRDYP